MRIDILSLFPDMFDATLGQSWDGPKTMALLILR